MNSEKLLKAIGEIDDRFIEEADASAPAFAAVRKNRRKLYGIAASFAVVVLAGAIALGTGSIGRRNSNQYPASVNTASSAVNTASSPVRTEDRSINCEAPSAGENSKNVSPDAAVPSGGGEYTSGNSIPKGQITDGYYSESEYLEGPNYVVNGEVLHLPGRSGYRYYSYLHYGLPGTVWAEWLNSH